MRKMIKMLSLSSLAIAALVLASCASVNTGANRLLAESPKAEPCRKELKRELSTVNLTVEMTAGELADTLNRVTPKSLYSGAANAGRPALAVARNGAIAVSIADNYVYLDIPVAISFSYGIFETPAVATRLKFRVSPGVTTDWQLAADVFYCGLSGNLAEEVRLGPLSVRPRSLVEGATAPLQRTLSETVTGKLNEKFPLKARVAKAWGEAQKPIRLDKVNSVWLVMSPREILLYPLYARDNRVRVSVGLTSYAEVVVGPEPAARAPVALPRLRPAVGADRRFRVAVNTEIHYRDLLAIASPLLLNRELGGDGRSVILKELDVYGNGDRLMVKVATAGSIEGVFYLTCRPVFNPQTNVVSVEDVDFDIESRNLLIKSADWLLHGSFRNSIREKLNMDLGQRLAQARELADRSMARLPLADNAILTGTVKDVRLNDVMVQKDRISIGVYLEGESAIRFR